MEQQKPFPISVNYFSIVLVSRIRLSLALWCSHCGTAGMGW